ncbi:RNA polymerase sigma factor SigB [Bacillus sp. EB600]|uniref:RNA polymerase sigma factor SigB n=1 Tax=Bacillus sp. EB600 TaxID=2806345 RepID=UPI00210A48D4|nr:RNA polymerase sigma factor SigB [Bacillus sp. EB600]MCQ6282620.1 RNA polymerase sigma factor SigB [Bacillus sp. EB600]
MTHQPSQITKRTKEEINELILEFQQNESNAAQTILVEQYTALVASVVWKYSKGGSYHDDLMQVGMLGLLGAIRRYDPNMGNTFESFLIPTIIGEIKRFLRDKTWDVHVPRRIKELYPRIKTCVDNLTSQIQRSPKIQEIAAYLGASEEEVLEAMEMGKSYRTLSVDQPIEADSDGSTVTPLDVIGAPDNGFKQVDQRMLLESLLPLLNEKEKDIIRYTFFENKSQKETGELLGISQMHVSRLQRKAINKLQRAFAHTEVTNA